MKPTLLDKARSYLGDHRYAPIILFHTDLYKVREGIQGLDHPQFSIDEKAVREYDWPLFREGVTQYISPRAFTKALSAMGDSPEITNSTRWTLLAFEDHVDYISYNQFSSRSSLGTLSFGVAVSPVIKVIQTIPADYVTGVFDHTGAHVLWSRRQYELANSRNFHQRR